MAGVMASWGGKGSIERWRDRFDSLCMNRKLYPISMDPVTGYFHLTCCLLLQRGVVYSKGTLNVPEVFGTLRATCNKTPGLDHRMKVNIGVFRISMYQKFCKQTCDVQQSLPIHDLLLHVVKISVVKGTHLGLGSQYNTVRSICPFT